MKENLKQQLIESSMLNTEFQIKLFDDTIDRILENFNIKDLDILFSGFYDRPSLHEPMIGLSYTLLDNIFVNNPSDFVNYYLLYHNSFYPHAKEYFSRLFESLLIGYEDKGWNELKKIFRENHSIDNNFYNLFLSEKIADYKNEIAHAFNSEIREIQTLMYERACTLLNLISYN